MLFTTVLLFFAAASPVFSAPVKLARWEVPVEEGVTGYPAGHVGAQSG